MKLKDFVFQVIDCQRRDLTINSMALTFTGQLIDPFNGKDDLLKGRVKFVGSAEERIKEDYLRILRWFRFSARFSSPRHWQSSYLPVIKQHSAGLRQISKERVWNEIKRIIVLPHGPMMMYHMSGTDVSFHIGMPNSNNFRRSLRLGDYQSIQNAQRWTNSPELLMALWIGFDNEIILSNLAVDWKWSNAERDHALWLCNNVNKNRDLCRLIAINNSPREWVWELAMLENRAEWERELLTRWQFGPFPVNGNDLIAIGFAPGPALGEKLAQLKEKWANLGYVTTKEQLLKYI